MGARDAGERSAYERTLRELYALSSRGIEPGLARVHAALALAGHPERRFEVVHVAGTNGKGSVSNAIFHGLGGRVGLFTSPHLHALTERFRVRGVAPVGRADVADAWAALRPRLEAPGAPRLTFFETVTLLSFRIFAARGVEVVVLETGLGGRLDATNVIERPRCCAITRIGFDHQAFLGDDLPSIAREKAGILKPGVPCVLAPQRPEARAVVAARAAEVGAPLVHADPERVSVAPSLAPHQRENAAVAAAALRLLEEGGLAVDVPRALAAPWPGRLETIRRRGHTFLLDAAHNPDGAAALARHLERLPGRRVLIFGAMADKDWPAMLASLRPAVDAVVFAASPLSRAERPAAFAARFDGTVAADLDDALAKAEALAPDPEDRIVAAGSIFLMAEIRARLLGLEADPPIAM
jgi:dihydrofolate synthase/folylpolyglutamate synthase